MGVVAIFFVVDAVFLRVVRRDHREVWDELGSPDMLHSNARKIYGYFLRRRYRDLPDRRFVCFCDLILVTQLVAFGFLAYFFALVVIFFVPRLFSA